MVQHGPVDYEMELVERYTQGDVAGMLEVEYLQFLQNVSAFDEKTARLRVAPGARSAIELVSHLAREVLPNGPAPSLSDALHAKRSAR